MTSRWFTCTVNNFPGQAQDFLEQFYAQSKAGYLIGQHEVGEEGTHHLQFVIWFKEKVRSTKLNKIFKGHYEFTKSPEASIKYCTKEETRLEGPFQYGVKPFKCNDAVDWSEQLSLAQQGKFDQMNPGVLIKHYGNIQKIHSDMYVATFTSLPSTIEVPEHGTHTIQGKRRHIWLWSDTPNTGKTTWAKSLDQYGTHWYGYKEHF